jgi:hypothetical protein
MTSRLLDSRNTSKARPVASLARRPGLRLVEREAPRAEQVERRSMQGSWRCGEISRARGSLPSAYLWTARKLLQTTVKRQLARAKPMEATVGLVRETHVRE